MILHTAIQSLSKTTEGTRASLDQALSEGNLALVFSSGGQLFPGNFNSRKVLPVPFPRISLNGSVAGEGLMPTKSQFLVNPEVVGQVAQSMA